MEAGLAVLDRSAKELDGILVTHEHSDHIQGLGVLARRYGIPIYATDGTIQAMQQTKSLGKFPEGIFHTIHADDTHADDAESFVYGRDESQKVRHHRRK